MLPDGESTQPHQDLRPPRIRLCQHIAARLTYCGHGAGDGMNSIIDSAHVGALGVHEACTNPQTGSHRWKTYGPDFPSVLYHFVPSISSVGDRCIAVERCAGEPPRLSDGFTRIHCVLTFKYSLPEIVREGLNVDRIAKPSWFVLSPMD